MSRTILGKYQLIKRLAVGGMGELYLAEEQPAPDVTRRVVIKSLLPQLARDEDEVRAFLDEGRIASHLNHPNIVSTYEVTRWEGTYLLVMELIDGPNLAELLSEVSKSGGLFSAGVAVRIVCDAARGLSYAHESTTVDGKPLAVVHRDLSPHNIMVRRDGIAKLVDFGIAKFKERAARTATGLVRGKVTYMSPEQLLSREIGPATDQYSLGIVLWEMLTLQRLFPLDAHGLPTPRPWRAPDPAEHADLPQGLSRIVVRMMAHDPVERFASCEEVVNALEPFAASYREVAAVLQETGLPRATKNEDPSSTLWRLTTSDDPEESTRPLNEGAMARSRSRRWIAVPAILALLAAAAWLRLSAGDPTPPPTQAAANASAPMPPPAATSKPATPPPTENTPRAAGERAEAPSKPARDAPRKKAKHRRKHATEGRSPRKAPAATGVSRSGTLTLETTPWTSVWIDGQRKGLTPLHNVSLSAGPHELRFVNEERGIDERRTLRVKAGEHHTEVFDLR